ncbi:MAG: ATP-dependent RecD-like DNA helicase [Christensenellaceae bacterium]|jgi:exodeoxyribonuclease V alpha subunit|nr:ATP-dependent RecD-like DNA helicase [Christensenellaceae bacterium]
MNSKGQIVKFTYRNPGFIIFILCCNGTFLKMRAISPPLNKETLALLKEKDTLRVEYSIRIHEKYGKNCEISRIIEHIPFINQPPAECLDQNSIILNDYDPKIWIASFADKFSPVETSDSNLSILPDLENPEQYNIYINFTIELITAYLSSDLFKGVGPAAVKKIVDEFGLFTLGIIESNPKKLEAIRGIGPITVKTIKKEYKKNLPNMRMYLFFFSQDISLYQVKKIYEEYESQTLDIVIHNPYVLINDISGIGFKKADTIALKIGIPRDSDFRLCAGIIYALKEEGLSGHTCCQYYYLIEKARTVLQIDISQTELIANALDILLNDGNVFEFIKQHTHYQNNLPNANRFIALRANYLHEESIAKKITDLIKRAKPLANDHSYAIRQYEQSKGISLDVSQKKAISDALNNGVIVITGGPGTGKTTIINAIIKIITTLIPELNSSNSELLQLAAPTGRAAKRLSELTKRSAKTIHRMLGFQANSGGGFKFHYNETNHLDAEVVIVDEISMADVFIFDSLLKALNSNARLILVGDRDQLPSVSAGNVLSDLIECKLLPVSCLTKIFRQGSESLIVSNAHNVNNKMPLVINNDSQDFYFCECANDEEILETLLDKFSTVTTDYEVEYDDVQVLAPMKKYNTGTENLNNELQKIVNPDMLPCLYVGQTTFKVGDRVMQTSNNYQMSWIKDITHERGSGVFNGEIGYIQNIDLSKQQITILFDEGRICDYTRKDCFDLMLAYAITVHKSQGSEFSVVFVVVPNSANYFLNKMILYTAITRARKAVILIGSMSTITHIIKKKNFQNRSTLLKELIWKHLKVPPQNLC